MDKIDPKIPLSNVKGISAKSQRQLGDHKVNDVEHLFFRDNTLIDAITLAENTQLTCREALDLRRLGHRHMETILADITAKRKVEPIDLLLKIHWLLGTVPEGEYRQDLIALEASALATIFETLESAEAATIEKLLELLFHRLLISPETTLEAEREQLIMFAEKFQKRSLLAYQTSKTKEILLAIGAEKEPTKQIIHLQKLVKHWKTLIQTMEQRSQEKGKQILTALQAVDSLKVLDISEKQLRHRLQQTMSIKKLRQSQLLHITSAMNAAIELRDAYLVSKLATRASQIWFELAQGKASKEIGNDLLRSLRFARTAVFHFRIQDDLIGTIKLLAHLDHLIGEIPSEQPEVVEEAISGVLKTFVNTLPLLDRPADQDLILRFTSRMDSLTSRVLPLLSDRKAQYNLAALHLNFQQNAIKQLLQLGADSKRLRELNRELIHAILRLTETASDEEREGLLNSAATQAMQLVANIKPRTDISEQELETISDVAFHLAQQPYEKMSDSARTLIEQSNQLNEQLYFQTKDSRIRSKLALQLLLAKISPTTAGRIAATFPSKELDKLEEFASKALLTQVKAKQPLQVLPAGALLVWIILQKIIESKNVQEKQKLKDDAFDFAETTLSFMPEAKELTEEVYRFAFLLLRNINELTQDERPRDDSKWSSLLTQGEQLAQTLARIAITKQEASAQIIALSLAATTTAKLATITASNSQRSKLLRRATTQIEKALQAAVLEGNPIDIETTLLQYNQLIRARLTINAALSAQIPILEELNQTYEETYRTVEKTGAIDSANRLHAYRILNAQIPLTFSLLSQDTETLESVRQKLIELLREVSSIGSVDQANLATELEKRWAYQIGEDSIIASGFRLEDAKTSFILADEHFRLNLQTDSQVAINNHVTAKKRTFPYLRSSSQPNELIWYDKTPILCCTYENEKLHTWLSLQDLSKNQVSVVFWLITNDELAITTSLQINAIKGLSQSQEGVIIEVAGAKIHVRDQPVVAEQRESRGILIYEKTILPGFPEPITLQIHIT